MPDQIKKFIQDHRSEMDRAEVPGDFFDSIMGSGLSDSVDYTRSRMTGWRMLTGVAATICMLIIAVILMDKRESVPAQTIAVKADLSVNAKEPVKAAVHTGETIVPSVTSEARPSKHLLKSRKAPLTCSSSSTIAGVKPQDKPYREDVSSIIPDLPETTSEKKPLKDEIITAREESGEMMPNVSQQQAASVLASRVDAAAMEHHHDDISDQYLGQKMKNRFFAFLSNKSRTWTNNRLAIDKLESDDRTLLSFRFDGGSIYFHKSVTIENNQ